jgi:hypothetical protein
MTEPTEIEFLILRNQRAIMRALAGLRAVDEQTLLTQGQETYDFLKTHDALNKKK